MDDGSRELVDAALSGQRVAQRKLIDLLAPVIAGRVGYTLMRCRPGRSGDIQDRKRDFTQEVLLKLIDRDFAKLRKWDAARGKLETFVGLITEREVIGILRSDRLNPWTDDLMEAEVIELRPDQHVGPEQLVASREALQAVLVVLRKKCSNLKYYMFQLIYLDERSVEEVCEVTGKTPAAVFQWRHRLAEKLPKLVAEFLSETGPRPRRASGG